MTSKLNPKLLSQVAAPVLIGCLLSAMGYTDFKQTSNLMPSVQAARICLQDSIKEVLPAGHRAFVDNFERAYGEHIQHKLTWRGAGDPLKHAVWTTLRRYDTVPEGYMESLNLTRALTENKTLQACAAQLGHLMIHWADMANSVRGDKIDHKLRVWAFGPGYFQDWPVYIAK